MNDIRHLTLRERIYEEIVRMIVSGELPSGAPLDEKALTEKLRVSRTPFREALGTLSKEGLIEIKPYRGFFVRSFSKKETEDLYELRKTLECFAVELAVPQMSDRHIADFERILDEAIAALKADDMRQGAIILAAFLVNAANADKPLPRLPIPTKPADADYYNYAAPAGR